MSPFLPIEDVINPRRKVAVLKRTPAAAPPPPIVEAIEWTEGMPLCQIGSELAYTEDEVVYLAVNLLAGNDPDFAAVRNDIGFNRLHARRGHELAQKPLREWSEYEMWSARKMLETYKNTQLRGVWSYMPPLSPTPPEKPWQRMQRERSGQRPGLPQQPQFRRLTLEEINGELVAVLEQNYDSELIAQIKALPQRRYDRDKYRWYVPLQLDALEPLIDFAVEHGYDIPENIEQAMSRVLGTFREAMEMSAAADTDRDFDLPAGLALYPFQKAGVAYAERQGNVLIADEMGLGKTVQALVAANINDDFPLVVICPASLKRNWERETKKWLPGKKVCVLDGNVHPIRFMGKGSMYDVLIVNYNSQILRKWFASLVGISPACIILDEAHNIKNAKAQQSKLVAELVTETEARVIALTGTPVVNRPMEFWQIVKVLGHAKTLGGWSEYKRRYDNERTEAHHELNVRARTHFMVRRLKKDVLKELPPKMYSTVPLEIINREQYRKAEGDIAGYFATKKSQDAKFLKEVYEKADELKLDGDAREAFIEGSRKDHFNASYMIASQNEALLRWEALKQLAVQGKIGSCIEWIDEFLANSEEKIVVFVTHTAIGEAIASRFNADFIHGGVKPDDRLPMVDRFQLNPARRVIVGNIIAMGEGLTLTAASNVAFIELGWNRKQHAQAEDRCHRIGQEDSVMVWNLVAEQTIEEEIIALIERKRVIADAIQDGDADTQREMMEQLQRMLDERLAGRKTTVLDDESFEARQADRFDRKMAV